MDTANNAGRAVDAANDAVRAVDAANYAGRAVDAGETPTDDGRGQETLPMTLDVQ